MKIVVISNSGLSICKFRYELLKSLIDGGHTVTVLTPKDDFVDEIVALGCNHIETPLSRHGTNPFSDLKLLCLYKKILKNIKADVVLTFTIKPNIYGAWACKMLNIPCVANVTGLGTAVENGGIIQKITVLLYKLAFKKVKTVFFQKK